MANHNNHSQPLDHDWKDMTYAGFGIVNYPSDLSVNVAVPRRHDYLIITDSLVTKHVYFYNK